MVHIWFYGFPARKMGDPPSSLGGWFVRENPIVRNGWCWLGVSPMTSRKPPCCFSMKFPEQREKSWAWRPAHVGPNLLGPPKVRTCAASWISWCAWTSTHVARADGPKSWGSCQKLGSVAWGNSMKLGLMLGLIRPWIGVEIWAR